MNPTGASWAPRSATSSFRAARADDVAEAKSEQSAGERAGSLGGAQPRGEHAGHAVPLREEKRAHRDALEPRSVQIGNDVLDAVLPGVEIEDELSLGVAGDVLEEARGGRARSTPRESMSYTRRGRQAGSR